MHASAEPEFAGLGPASVLLFAVLGLLPSCGGDGESVIDRSVRQLRDADPRVRWEALKTLRALGPQAAAATQALTDVLRDEDNSIRIEAAGTIRAIGPGAAKAVPQLALLLKDRDQCVVFAAIGALGAMGPSAASAVPDLIVASLDSANHDAFAMAVEKIGPGASAAVPRLVSLLEVGRNKYAASALGRVGHGTGDSIAALTATVADRSSAMELRWVAVDSLGRIGPDARSAIPTLMAAQADGLDNAVEALRKIRASR